MGKQAKVGKVLEANVFAKMTECEITQFLKNDSEAQKDLKENILRIAKEQLRKTYKVNEPFSDHNHIQRLTSKIRAMIDASCMGGLTFKVRDLYLKNVPEEEIIKLL